MDLTISEKYLNKIATTLKLQVFKIGVRKAFKTSDFEGKFDEFVQVSSDLVIQQTGRRKESAERHYKMIESFVRYGVLSLQDSEWKRREAYEFCREYEPEAFKAMTQADFESLLKAKSLRSKRPVEEQKRIWASLEAKALRESELEKALAEKAKQERKRKREAKKAAREDLGGTESSDEQDND